MTARGKKTTLTTADYCQWIGELKMRYRATQIKAAVAVNSALIEFYWNLGKDISEKYPGEVYGSKFFEKLSADLRQALPGVRGFSKVNLIYCRQFFELYRGMGIVPQLVEQLVLIPWGHHRTLIDKCKGDREKALFYVRRTIQNGWSRNTLLNWLSTDLYECEGKGQTNFALTMPSDDCDLAQQLVKDPQVFEVFGLREQYNEAELKAAIVANIEKTLLSLGKGVAFLGREYPIGVLICKEHNRVLAKFHLDKLDLPMGITDYEIKKILPTPAQLAKCYADAEAQIAAASAAATNLTVKRSPKKGGRK